MKKLRKSGDIII